MSIDPASALPVPTGFSPLAARVREAIEPLVHGPSIDLHVAADSPGLVRLAREALVLVVLAASDFAAGTDVAADAIAGAVRGDHALVVVGTLPAAAQSLLSRGVYDVVDDTAPPARMTFALRNAFEMLELKDRAESRSRWLRRFRYEASALIETARALSTERDTHKLLGLILEKSRYMVGADAGSIYVVEGEDPDIAKRSLRFKLSQNESVSFQGGEFVLPISTRSIAGTVAMTRQVLALDDVYNLAPDAPYAFDPSFDAKVSYRTRSVLTVPLVSAADDVIGVVQLINKKREPRARLRSPGDVFEQVVPFDARSVELVASLAAQAGVALENAMLYDEIRRIFDGFVRASVQAIEQRDPTTSGHSQRVSVLSLRLADAVDRTDVGPLADAKFSAQDLRELEYASLLHDFGKIGVREEVLVKAKKLYDAELRLLRARFDYLHRDAEAEIAARRADLFARNAPVAELHALESELAARRGAIEGYWDVIREANEPTVMAQGTFERIDEIAKHVYIDPRGASAPWLTPPEVVSLKVARGSLRPDEIAEIRSHVEHTYQFLARIPWGKSFANVPRIAGCHHEKINGKGYPRGMRGAEIPLGSRVMAVADIFDALTASDRPYKKAVPVDKALGILEYEVRDGGLDGELVRLFIQSGAYRAIGGPTS